MRAMAGNQMLSRAHSCILSTITDNNMKLSNISSIRALMHHRPQFNCMMRAEAQACASSSVRHKVVFYMPARNLLGRIRVVFSGAGAQRQRAIERWNTMVGLYATLPQGAAPAQTHATKRAMYIAYAKYMLAFSLAGESQQVAMADALTPDATRYMLTCLKDATSKAKHANDPRGWLIIWRARFLLGLCDNLHNRNALNIRSLEQSRTATNLHEDAGSLAPTPEERLSVTSAAHLPSATPQPFKTANDPSSTALPAVLAAPECMPPVVEVGKAAKHMRPVAPEKLQHLLDIAAKMAEATNVMAAALRPVPSSEAYCPSTAT